MHRNISILALAAALAACGGEGSGGGVTAASPTPTPAPTPTPPSPPTFTYSRYTALTGDQNFRTACASVLLSGNPFQARPATAFGNGFALAYTAATDTYGITGDGITTNFGPTERDPAAPVGTQRYLRVVNGFTQRFSIGQPTAAGTGLDYTRGFGLTAQGLTGTPVQYGCIFGVPTVVGDAPAGSNIPFARVSVNGAAYVNQGGALLSYSLTGSTATLAANVTSGTITTTIQLIGVLQTASGPTGGNIALGSYTGTGSIDTVVGSFNGTLADSVASPTVNGTFGGWFFGPQGAEGAYVLTMSGVQPGTSNIMTVTATVAAIRQ